MSRWQVLRNKTQWIWIELLTKDVDVSNGPLVSLPLILDRVRISRVKVVIRDRVGRAADNTKCVKIVSGKVDRNVVKHHISKPRKPQALAYTLLSIIMRLVVY
jgi:hypothetical protein